MGGSQIFNIFGIIDKGLCFVDKTFIITKEADSNVILLTKNIKQLNATELDTIQPTQQYSSIHVLG